MPDRVAQRAAGAVGRIGSCPFQHLRSLADVVQEITGVRQLATTRSADAVVDHVKRQLTDLLQLQMCRFEHGSLLGHPTRLEQDGSVVGCKRWDIDQRGRPRQDIELRTSAGGRFQGRFMLTPASAPPLIYKPAWSPSLSPTRT
ncbi:hypothetical protein AB0H51_27285 [Streptomyces griseoluteus]|uniref:hypothetical protein n=1 Tax=Streptomyces griseoluteus TaxID=29306 RepID=UPI0033E649A9